MQFLFSLISGFIEGFWRRWFGGYFNHTESFGKIGNYLMGSRGTQTIFNILFLTLVFMLTASNWITTPLCSWLIGLGVKDWCMAVIMASVFQFQFWSRGHGPAFDMGRGGLDISEELYDRYHREVWSKLPDKVIPEEHWHGFFYDFVWMWSRYTYGALFMVPFFWSFYICWLGLIITAVYALSWTINEKDNWLFKYFPHDYVASGTNLGEVLGGFLTGVFLVMM